MRTTVLLKTSAYRQPARFSAVLLLIGVPSFVGLPEFGCDFFHGHCEFSVHTGLLWGL